MEQMQENRDELGRDFNRMWLCAIQSQFCLIFLHEGIDSISGNEYCSWRCKLPGLAFILMLNTEE